MLSRASLFDQRIGVSFVVQGNDGDLNSVVARVGVSEGLMGEMMRIEVALDHLDQLQFKCARRQLHERDVGRNN